MELTYPETSVSAPGTVLSFGEQFPLEAPRETLRTVAGLFENADALLSSRPLREPRRVPAVSNEMLKSIASRNPPPPEWFEGEDEKPFEG